VLEQVMGAQRTPGASGEVGGNGEAARTDGGTEDQFVLRGHDRGGWIAFDQAPAERGRQSAGIVHHVAWSTTDAEQGEWLKALNEVGIPNSGLVDRHYFHSVYFREPGGVLYELATEEPGFTVDGPVEELGKRIILPPWLESERARVEARLTPLDDPRADWPVRQGSDETLTTAGSDR
jgi:glyoxalase family protein